MSWTNLAHLLLLSMSLTSYLSIGRQVSVLAATTPFFPLLTTVFVVFFLDGEHPQRSLTIACLRTNLLTFLGNTVPQLFYSAFTISQPLLLKSVVLYAESAEKTPGQRDGLIIATLFIFMGIGVCS